MRIIVDMNLSRDWVPVLSNAGFDCVHWSSLGPQDSSDEDIMAYAEMDGAVVLTRDLDFGTYLAMTGRSGPSVVQLRAQRAKPARHVELVVKSLRDAEAALGFGALVTIDAESVRVRLLPFPPKPQQN